MNPSVIASVLYTAIFIACFVALFRLKKSANALRGMKWLLLTLLTEMLYGTFVAGIINICKIPVNLWSMSVVYLVLLVWLIWRQRKTNETQEYVWDKFEIFYWIFIGIGIFGYFIHRDSIHLTPYLLNSDAAIHLKNATQFVKTEQLPTMYHTAMHNGLIIEVLLPWMKITSSYIVYMIMEILGLYAEVIMFMICIEEFTKKFSMKIFSLILCLFFALGYPFYGFIFNYHYWGVGVMLIAYVILMLHAYQTEGNNKNMAIAAIMIGCNGVTMCYMLFGPVTFVAAFICLLVYQQNKKKLVSLQTVKISLIVFLIPTILALYYSYVIFLKADNYSVGELMKVSGSGYTEPYFEFMFILPLVVYGLVEMFKEKKHKEMFVFSMTFFVFQVGLAVVYIQNKVATYYYYKYYHVLWFLAFVSATYGVMKLIEKNKEMLIALVLIFVALFGLCITHTELKFRLAQPIYNQKDYSNDFFQLYKNNRQFMAKSLAFTEEDMELFEYVADNLSDEEVPMFASALIYKKNFWYEATTMQDNPKYYAWVRSWDSMWKNIKKDHVKYLLLPSDSEIYEKNQELFDSFEVLFQNDAGKVVVIPESMR